MILQACSFSPRGWGLIDLPLRASNEGLPRPHVARAQKIIRLHPFFYSGSTRQTWAAFQEAPISHTSLKRRGQVAFYCAHRTSTFRSCAFCEQEGHPATPLSSFQARSLLSPQGVASDCPLLRASNEHLLSVRVPRAKRTSEVTPSPPF